MKCIGTNQVKNLRQVTCSAEQAGCDIRSRCKAESNNEQKVCSNLIEAGACVWVRPGEVALTGFEQLSRFY